MDWLGGWLKSVVLVIMLAIFIDLILPSNTMQRYVRTVLSLFILLTMLSPLFSLFHKQWSAEKLLAEASHSQNEQAAGRTTIAGLPRLDQITRESEQVKKLQSKQAQQLAAAQLQERMRPEIEKASGMKVKNIRVETSVDGKGQGTVASVSVTLQERRPEAAAGSAARTGPAPIKPVEPVEAIEPIRIGRDKSDSVSAAATVRPDEEELPPQAVQSRTAVQKLLRDQWGLDSSQVTIGFDFEKGR